ncbi:MAG: NifU family protein [Candidatus Bathyarchaeia archaeon]
MLRHGYQVKKGIKVEDVLKLSDENAVKSAIEEIRLLLQNDGGDVEFVGFADGIVSAKILTRDSDGLRQPIEFVRHSYRLLLVLYLLTLLLFCLSPLFTKDTRAAGYALIGGWSGLIWWVGVVGVGIVVPLVLVFKKGVFSKQIFSRVSVCVTIGGLLMRILILFAGQKAL